jgi:hypothetical protein
MADLSLDNVLGYSDLVLLDTSFISRDFGIRNINEPPHSKLWGINLGI